MALKRDYHMHSTCSDGSLSPAELVQRAENKGLYIMAITDHDGTDGIAEAMAEGARRGVRVVPGVEFSAVLNDRIPMHILGYSIDRKNLRLADKLAEVRERRRERNDRLLAGLNRQGYAIDSSDLLINPGQDYIGKPIFAKVLCAKGYISSPKEAFEPGKFLESPEIKKIKKIRIDAEEAVKLINEAGGTAVLAHPGLIEKIGSRETEEFFANIQAIIKQLKKSGLRGMECIYPKHSDYEMRMFKSIAASNGLIITRGSDFHGEEFE